MLVNPLTSGILSAGGTVTVNQQAISLMDLLEIILQFSVPLLPQAYVQSYSIVMRKERSWCLCNQKMKIQSSLKEC